LFEEGLKQVCN